MTFARLLTRRLANQYLAATRAGDPAGAVGLWKRVITRKGVQIALASFAKLGKGDRERFAAAAEGYAEFLGQPAEIIQAVPAQVRRQRRQ